MMKMKLSVGWTSDMTIKQSLSDEEFEGCLRLLKLMLLIIMMAG